MSTSSHQQALHPLAEAVQALDTAITLAVGGQPLLAANRLPADIPECAELRFMFVVSTLYKLYREAGADDLKFLNSKLAGLHQDSPSHYDLVNDLRTFDQHDVQGSSSETLRRRERCRLWFQKAVELPDAPRPVGEVAWTKCTLTLLSDAVAYLGALRSYIAGLQGAAADYVKKEWVLLRTRSIPHGDFDRMTAEVAGDIGMESRDIVAFRNQHYGRILLELRAQRYDVDVKGFVKRAITARLLDEFPGPILVAEDLKAFGMKPGRDLGKALREAQQVWIQSDCELTRDQVIARLQQLGLVRQTPSAAASVSKSARMSP